MGSWRGTPSSEMHSRLRRSDHGSFENALKIHGPHERIIPLKCGILEKEMAIWSIFCEIREMTKEQNKQQFEVKNLLDTIRYLWLN